MIPFLIQCHHYLISEAANITRFNEKAIIIRQNDIWYPADSRPDKGLSAPEGLKHDGRITFIEARKHKNIACIYP